MPTNPLTRATLEEIMEDEDRILRDVNIDGYRLQTWDTYRERRNGPQWAIAYRFTDRNGKVIFQAEDFGCSPMHAIDSDACLRGILGFLTLRRGDTDPEYFDDYTPAQIEFSETDAEELSMWSLDPDDEIGPMEFPEWDDE